MNKIQYDSEGRRLGAEIATTYHAWCEACAWRAPDRVAVATASRDQAIHDADKHAV